MHLISLNSSAGPLLCDDVPGPASLHCEAGRTDIASNSVSPESFGEGLSRWGEGKGGGADEGGGHGEVKRLLQKVL